MAKDSKNRVDPSHVQPLVGLRACLPRRARHCYAETWAAPARARPVEQGRAAADAERCVLAPAAGLEQSSRLAAPGHGLGCSARRWRMYSKTAHDLDPAARKALAVDRFSTPTARLAPANETPAARRTALVTMGSGLAPERVAWHNSRERSVGRDRRAAACCLNTLQSVRLRFMRTAARSY